MLIDSTGWLAADPGDPELLRVPTPRTVALNDGAPLGLVWHWTGSGHDDDRGDRDSRNLAAWIADPKSSARASWHVLIDRSGTVIQSAPVTVGTWHVGKSGLVAGEHRSVNRTTLGIELENLGELRHVEGVARPWPFDVGVGIDPGRGVRHAGKWFDGFTAAQEDSAARLVFALAEHFRWTREAFLYGHVDFDPKRKQDPGPLWREVVLPRVLDRVFPAGLTAA